MRKLLLLTTLTLIALGACNKTDNVSVKPVAGTYIGSLTKVGSNGLSVVLPENATSIVTKTSNVLIEVHCFGNELDTIFMLNYYENQDSTMVCLTDDDFQHMYGHILGKGHMSGGMMGDRGNDETEWEHHMNDEHTNSDEHFGGFDMMKNTFGYKFKMTEGDSIYYLKFTGVKQ